MKKKRIVALLLLLVVIGLQVCCSQHAIKIEKVIEERRINSILDINSIH